MARSGIRELAIEVRCLQRPVHSGQKGGPVPDPVQILCRLIADLAAADGASFRVIDLESRPFHRVTNAIVDVARARIAVRGSGADAGRLIRTLVRDPPYRAQVRARIVRRAP